MERGMPFWSGVIGSAAEGIEWSWEEGERRLWIGREAGGGGGSEGVNREGVRESCHQERVA